MSAVTVKCVSINKEQINFVSGDDVLRGVKRCTIYIRCINKKRGAVMAPLFGVMDDGYLLITMVLL